MQDDRGPLEGEGGADAAIRATPKGSPFGRLREGCTGVGTTGYRMCGRDGREIGGGVEAGVFGLTMTMVIGLSVEGGSLSSDGFTSVTVHDWILHGNEHGASGHTAAEVGGGGDHVVPPGVVGVQPLYACE